MAGHFHGEKNGNEAGRKLNTVVKVVKKCVANKKYTDCIITLKNYRLEILFMAIVFCLEHLNRFISALRFIKCF